jgi:hypothetical protein
MHDHFWSLAGRTSWYEPEPKRFTTLAKFFVDYGQLRYGTAWDGLKGKPSEATAKPLREEIAQRAASGDLKTYTLDPNTFEFELIGASHWRNDAAFRAIFARCQIDPSDPAKVASDGSDHGRVFVSNGTASAVLTAMGLSSSSSHSSVVTTDYLSTYIRFLIRLAQSERLDPSLSAKAVQAKIEDHWENWRKSDPSLVSLGHHADLSDRMKTGMRVLLRGETARIERTAGARKNSVIKKSA